MNESNKASQLVFFSVFIFIVYGPNSLFFLKSDYNNGVTEVAGPCADYKPGEDDLQAFDFIRKFKLDVVQREYPGVTKVRGSNRVQSAYRLSKDADLNLPTRSPSCPIYLSSLFRSFFFQRKLNST